MLFIVYFFLHLFILQALYFVLQDLKMKILFVEISGHKNKWRGQDIVKLTKCWPIRAEMRIEHAGILLSPQASSTISYLLSD